MDTFEKLRKQNDEFFDKMIKDNNAFFDKLAKDMKRRNTIMVWTLWFILSAIYISAALISEYCK